MSELPERPDEARCDELLDALAARLELHGADRFVRGPLVEPSPRFFPDAYEHGPAGVRTVARRALRHVGLGSLAVRVVDFREPGPSSDLLSRTVVALVGFEGNVVELQLEQLGAPEDLVPTISHVVADAAGRAAFDRRELATSYRASASPVTGDAEDDMGDRERYGELVSVDEVVLGLGILALIGSHRYRAAGTQYGREAYTQWSHERVGGLASDELAYLLAVQLAVRGASTAERTRVVAALPPNQASDLRAWLDAVGGDGDVFAEALLLPARDDAPPSWQPDVSPLEPGEQVEDDPPRDFAAEHHVRNAGHPVFRVPHDQATLATTFGAVAGATVGGILCLAAEWPAVSGLAVAALVAGGARWVAHSRARLRCSETDCEATVDAGDATCPGCGGTLAGDIANASERLAAAEAHEARRRRAARRRR